MNSPRRHFVKRVLAAAGWLGAASGAHAAQAAAPVQSRPRGKKVFVSSAYFSGPEDQPEDLFGDLGLLRKGTPSMMSGSSPTSIEPITTRQEWAAKAAALQEIFQMTLGIKPADHDCDLNLRVDGEKDRGDVIERQVSYLLSPGERVTSLMLIPKGARFPSPAVLTIHPTTADGKEQTVGRGEMIDGQLPDTAVRRAYGLHLAQRGYITFSPDLLGAGSRMFRGRRAFDNQPFIDAHPRWSGSGKDLHDLQRALDVMQRMPEIDGARIASLGHSQGAGLTCYLAAVDSRICVGVANCGVWPTRIRENPFNVARTTWWTGRPALRPFCLAGKPMPIDAHELLALTAPRPFLNIVALNDSGFTPADEPLTRGAWENLAANVRKIYALHGVEDRFQTVLHMLGHDFHDAMRERAYAFLDQTLRTRSLS